MKRILNRKISNVLFSAFTATLILTIGLGCKSLTGSKTASNDTTPTTTSSPTTANSPTGTVPAEKTTAPTTKQTAVEKADFTATAEDLDKEFTKKGVTDKELEKYAKKNIAVTGKVSMLVLEKQGTTLPWVTLYAPGVLHGVSCYFDEDATEQMQKLKMDKTVTVQGMMDDFIVPEISPRLEHCVVVKAD